jgi:hypothetical protein
MAVTNDSPEAPHYGLYFNYYSICSLMVLYTLALRGEPKDPESEMIVDTYEVDIFHEAQLEEQFLCEINAKGQVYYHAETCRSRT